VERGGNEGQVRERVNHGREQLGGGARGGGGGGVGAVERGGRRAVYSPCAAGVRHRLAALARHLPRLLTPVPRHPLPRPGTFSMYPT
jgi:hypothetical protein